MVIGQPQSFTYHYDGHSQALTFAIPAGVYLSGTWSKAYRVPNPFLIQDNHSSIKTASGTHSTDFPQPVGPAGIMDTVPVTSLQLADINGAADSTLNAIYVGTGVNPTLVEQDDVISLTLVSAGGVNVTFERATVYEGAQIGVESTPGVVVAATKRLLGLEIDMENMPMVNQYRPQGNKFFTTRQVGKEYTAGTIKGILCFNDMLYVASSWLGTGVVTTPTSNSKWNVTSGSGTIGFTFKGSVLAPSAWANAAAFQAAIEAMPSVGTGNVIVTGAAPTYAIQFTGVLSTDVSAITSPTGTPTPTIALDTAATLTRRWTFTMAPAGPDTIQTYTVEKGALGVSSQAQRAAFGFVGGINTKFSKSEASFDGSFMAQATVDPVTMTASPVDVACVPVDPKSTAVWMGTSLAAMVKMQRLLTLELGVQNRASGLMTLNDDDTSFSNRIEGVPDLSTKFFVEHNSEGQAMLARLRNNTPVYAVVQNLGPLIEAGFNYRMKWTYRFGLVKPNTSDVDGAYGRDYDGGLEYDSTLGTAIKLEIDTTQSAL